MKRNISHLGEKKGEVSTKQTTPGTSDASCSTGTSHALKHVAIIMDGNGRWARARHLPRTAGHKKGLDTIKSVIESCKKHHIPYLTLYAFSWENWRRSKEEIHALMDLLRLYLDRELNALHKNNIRLKVIGEIARLDADIRERIEKAEKLTQANTGLCLTVALSYGSRQEIASAVREIVTRINAGTYSAEEIDADLIEKHLYTATLPELDLLIRTGGEQRLSNFLLWQSAYTELFFSSVLWPDFGEKEFDKAIETYEQRERRYGTAH